MNILPVSMNLFKSNISFNARSKTKGTTGKKTESQKGTDIQYNIKITDEAMIKEYEQAAIQLAHNKKIEAARIKKEVESLFNNNGMKNGKQVATIERGCDVCYPKIIMYERDSKGNITRRSEFSEKGKLYCIETNVQEVWIGRTPWFKCAEQFYFDDSCKQKLSSYSEDILREQCGIQAGSEYGKMLYFTDDGNVASYETNKKYYDGIIFQSEYRLWRGQDGELVLYRNFVPQPRGFYGCINTG